MKLHMDGLMNLNNMFCVHIIPKMTAKTMQNNWFITAF